MVKSLFFAKINEQKTTILSILGHFKRLEVNFFLNILAHSGRIFRKIRGAFFVAKSQKPRNAEKVSKTSECGKKSQKPRNAKKILNK